MSSTTNRIAVALGGALLIGGAIAAGLAGTSLLQPHYAPAPPTTSTEREGQRFGDQLQVPKDVEPSDFTIEVIITSKQCFGPASCVYTYNISPNLLHFGEHPHGKAMTVIYTVTGGNQDQIENFTVDEAGVCRWQTKPIIGPDNATFTATATRVIVGN